MGARGGAQVYEREDGAALLPLPLGHCRRQPEKHLLHQLVCAHLDTLLAERRADDPDGYGLPAYVEQEFRRFIDCGVASRGFVRVVCDRCKQEMVVGFSCKGMGFCPSCLGRRMNDTAAQLVDRVLPFSPYRQWVLSLPFRLRLLLAKEGRLLGKVRTIFMRTVRSWQRLQARRLGLRDAQTAAVCFTQLFGSRLDCSPHFHALAPDAVFLESEEGDLELWRLPQPTREEIAKLVERIARRTLAMLKMGVGEDLRLDALDRLRAVTHEQLSFSTMAEPKEEREGKLSARCEGFSLQAGRHLHEKDREGLEALLRYCLRPPVSQERLSMAEDGSGKVVLKLKRPLADGRATLEMTPSPCSSAWRAWCKGPGATRPTITAGSPATRTCAVGSFRAARRSAGAAEVRPSLKASSSCRSASSCRASATTWTCCSWSRHRPRERGSSTGRLC